MSIKRIIKNISFSDIGTVAFGASVSQILIIISIPLLTRIYTPEEFGSYSIFSSIVAMSAVACTLRYELAIPLPKNDSIASNLTMLSLITTFIFSLLLLLLISILSILDLVPSIMSYFIWLIPFSVLISGVFQVLTYRLIREKKFKTISNSRITQTVSTVISQLILYKLSQLGLAVGQILGQLFSIFIYKYRIKTESIREISFIKLIDVSKNFKKFPYYSLPTSLVNSAGQHLPSLIIAATFGAKSAGIFFLTSKLVSLPMTVLGGAVSNVYISNAREQNELNNLKRYSLDYLIFLICLITPVIIAAVLFGDSFVRFILGENWGGSGEILKWLIIIGSVQFITSPIGQILLIKDKQEIGLIYQVFLTVLKIIGLMIGVYYEDFIIGIIFYSLLGSLGYFWFLMASIKHA